MESACLVFARNPLVQLSRESIHNHGGTRPSLPRNSTLQDVDNHRRRQQLSLPHIAPDFEALVGVVVAHPPQ